MHRQTEPGSELDSVGHDAAGMRRQAAQCRRLASSVLDRRTYDALIAMAAECEEAAERIDREGPMPPQFGGVVSGGDHTSRD